MKLVDLSTVQWNFRYNKNNQTYKMLISICYLTAKGLLQTTSKGTTQLMDFLDDQMMSRLYEKFILEYYKKQYPELSAAASQIPWGLDAEFDESDGSNVRLPVMQSDIHLQRGNTVLIIDAKYYGQSTVSHYDNEILRSGHLYQIFTYVKNRQYQFGDDDNNVSGLLLYAKTESAEPFDVSYKIHGNRISAKTLDLDVPFDEIRAQLDAIIRGNF